MASPTDENVQLNHAPPAPTDGVTTKRQRLQTNEAPPTAIGRVLDVEMLLRGLLTLLDLASLASFLEVVAADESWRGILTNEELWGEMLRTHFGGGLPAVEQFNDGRIVEEEEDDDEEEEGEDLPMDQEEEEEEEPDLIELLEGEMDVEDADSDVENEDDEEDVVIVLPPPPLPRPRAGRSARRVAAVAAEAEAEAAREGSQGLSVNWIEGVPSQKVLDLACADLKDFLRSAEQLVQFNARLQIIRGDIGEIERVGEQRIDGLAFPTAPGLRNPHTGAAAVIHNRAGQGMTAHVRTWNGYLGLGDAHVTPGFDAGVDKLIHCVGPTGLTRDCLKELQRTYRSVLRCIQHENLSCVAMASISTGNNGLPVDSASWFALCAIQRYMRSTPNWTATIGIVCFEADAYAAFSKSKSKLLAQFNADCVRANPPLRLR